MKTTCNCGMAGDRRVKLHDPDCAKRQAYTLALFERKLARDANKAARGERIAKMLAKLCPPKLVVDEQLIKLQEGKK
jgi:hypothetical protein